MDPAHTSGTPGQAHDTGALSPGFSVYLDLTRFTAAMLVFIEHARLSGLVQAVPGLDRLAGEAVAIFFVLSGYIIASTTAPARGWRAFAIARAARIYSVVLPALLLGVIVKGGYVFSQGGAAALGAFLADEVSPLKVAAVLTFTGEIWTVRIGIPWDGPIWSLNYEVFYYLLFGVLTFMTGRKRVLLAILLCLAAGPKILVLMPCWWLGVLLARRTDLAFRSRAAAWVALFAAPAALWALNRSGLPEFVKRDVLYQVVPGFWRLEDATNVATYYADMIFIAAAFVAARQLDFQPGSWLMRRAPLIQWLAGSTFSLYLFHRPFQNLLAALYATHSLDLPPLAALAGILAVVAALAAVTEKRKDTWRRVFTRLLGKPAPAVLAPTAASPAA